MKHVILDGYEEAVKRFVLALSNDADDSVLEIGGRAVAWVVRIREDSADAWTDAKNDRRCDLVDKKIHGTLSAGEALELESLQSEMLRHRAKVAPLPLEYARQLHQALLNRAASGEPAGQGNRTKWSVSQITSWFVWPSASGRLGCRKMRRGLL